MALPVPQEMTDRSPFKGFLPFFWLALACVSGIVLADALHLPAWFWLLGMAFCILLWVLALVLPRTLAATFLLQQWAGVENRLPGIFVLLVFFIGGVRFSFSRAEITARHGSYYNDRGSMTIIGEVIDMPDVRDSMTILVIGVDSLFPLEESFMEVRPDEISGKMVLQTQPGIDYAYGDQLKIVGELKTPDESAEFSYKDYLAHKGIFSVMSYARVERIAESQGNPIKAFLYDLRAKSYETLQALFPYPESDLLAGILLGRDQGLSSEIDHAFQRTGTTHIIAISGFNIAILAGLFSGVFTRLFGRKWGAITAVVAISAYTILVGGEAAVIRAAIMGGLGVLGGMFGKRQNGLNSLGLAVLIMILMVPDVPWDLGFQLSVAATLGLVLYAQPLEEGLTRLSQGWVSEEHAERIISPISEFFLFTMAAQVMTLPLITYHFGGISWLALIANPLILPPQPLVMILGGLAMLVGMFLPGLGQVLSLITLPFVRYTIRMVSWLAHLPGGDLVLPEFSNFWLIIFYGVLFLLTLVPVGKRKELIRKVLTPQAGLLVLSGLVFLIWGQVLTRPDEKLHLVLIDSEGTLLIQAPGGKAVLVGGGASPSHLKQTLGQLLPAGKSHLEVILVGSSNRDDLVGLTGILETFPVEQVLWGINPEQSQVSRRIYAIFTEKESEIHTMLTGQSLDLGDGISLDVLRCDGQGAVFWLSWQNFNALLPVGKQGNQKFDPPDAPDVILLNDGISSEDLSYFRFQQWQPAVILLPLSENDVPVRGENEVIAGLSGYPLVSTLDSNWVKISTDGNQLWVVGE